MGKNYEIRRELKNWDDNVLFDVKFKENTSANLQRLDEFIKISLEHYIIIAANSEPLVYKIGRYFIEQGIKYKDMYFLDGAIVKSYLGDDASEWRKKERCDEFFKMFGPEMRSKFVLIPYMDFSISVSLAIYFATNLKSYGALGFLFYAEGDDNLSEVLNLNYNDPYLFEFPKKLYRKRKRQLIDDEY